jgi:hypothetical protein
MAAVRHDGLERGVCFLLLAAYVLSDAIGALVGGKEPAWLVPLVA